MPDEPFRRGDLVWVIDAEPGGSRHRLGIVLAPEDEHHCLLIFQGDGLMVGAVSTRCVRVRLEDRPGAAVHNFAEILRPPPDQIPGQPPHGPAGGDGLTMRLVTGDPYRVMLVPEGQPPDQIPGQPPHGPAGGSP